MYIYVSFTSAELRDRRVLQNSWTEIELESDGCKGEVKDHAGPVPSSGYIV